MPDPSLVRNLRAALGSENVLSAPSELAVYECDAFTIERRRPAAAVFPRSTEQVAEVLRICRRFECPVVARGAGTSLCGGCVPSPEGVLLALTRMNRVLGVRLRDGMAVVEPGVLNLQLTRALAGTGYHFAPDPSSQHAATIGGNVATNAGGPHTLKYGVTVNHVLGVEAVLGDGLVVELGPVENPAALDLVGLLCGSEGTLAILTKIWVRLTPDPQDYRTLRVVFDSVDDATHAVSRIIAEGIIPAAMELMDQGILAAVEEAFHGGFPLDAPAVLVIEVDGSTAGVEESQHQIAEICRQWRAREILQARTPEERELLWKCRKLAVGAVGRLSPSYLIEDGVVPRTRLPHILGRIAEIAQRHGVRIVNVAHAGDGNIHPILLFDERDRGQVQRALAAGRELLQECIACGGSITAEHGIGIEKLTLMEQLFDAADLDAMRRVRQSFDPAWRLNPGKKLLPLDVASSPPGKGHRHFLAERPGGGHHARMAVAQKAPGPLSRPPDAP
jgi:glycolate oxidase